MSPFSFKFLAALAFVALIPANAFRHLGDVVHGTTTPSFAMTSARSLSWAFYCARDQTAIYGGTGGTSFDFNSGDSVYIQAIGVKYEDVIRSTAVALTDGRSQGFGGIGGRDSAISFFNFGTNEYVKQIVLYKNLLSDKSAYVSGGFQITTNRQTANLGPCGSKQMLMLTCDLHAVYSYAIDFDDEDRVRLTGVVGRAGDWLNAVGFRYTSSCGSGEMSVGA